MNLYIFNELSKASVYGVGTYLRELIEVLRCTHINVFVVKLMSNNPQIQKEEIDGIRYWNFPSPIQEKHSIDTKRQNELYCHNIVCLLQLHIENKNNLIFHLNYNQYGEFAKELKQVFDCRIIATIHSLAWSLRLFGNVALLKKILTPDELDQKEELKNTIIQSFRKEKDLYETVDRIISLSEHTKHILLDDYQINPKKIKVIYNGISDRNFFADKHELRQKYHIPDVPVFLFAGRLDEGKGLTFAIQAFRKVHNRNNCHFIIAGNGVFDLFMKECEGIWMYVTWTGMINKECLYDLYSIADIGILPSLSEQCNYVAIEMMMHGLPIVTSAAPGLAEMTEDGISSLQVPVTEYPDKVEIDTDLLAEKMLYLLQNPDERQRLGSNARKRYEEVYTMDVFRKNMIAFYQSIYE